MAEVKKIPGLSDAKTKLRNAIMLDKALSAQHARIGWLIADYIRDEEGYGYSWPSQDDVAKALGCDVRSVQRATKVLAPKYFRIEASPGDGRAHRYYPAAEFLPDILPGIGAEGTKLPDKKAQTTRQKSSELPDRNEALSLLNYPVRSLARRGETADGALEGAAGSRGNHLGTAGARLEKKLGKDAFGSWFGSAAIIGLAENVLSLSVPTKFLESWIRTHYADAVIECWRAEGSPIDRLEIEVRASETRPAGSQHGARAPPARPQRRIGADDHSNPRARPGAR